MSDLPYHDADADSDAMRRWREVRNVLAVRLDNLGDLLMTTPALAAIRHTLPQARLTVLTSREGALAAAHLPDIDDVMVFQAPWMKSPANSSTPLGRRTLNMARRLAARQFDGAIIFTVCTQSALPAAMFCLLANIPLRLAYSRENPYALLTDWVRDTDVVRDGMRHEVTRQLALVAHVGLRAPNERLRFNFTDDHAPALKRRMSAAGMDPESPYFVVHPGASAPSRRYPAERFGQAARLIAEHSGCHAIFTGSSHELSLVEEARAAMGIASVSLAGALTLGELGALVAGARVLVTNNSGPAHIAAALNRPVVDLYALTNPQHTPWKVPSRVLFNDVPCRNCLKSICPEGHHACLLGVSPQRVAQAGLELMGLDGAIVPPDTTIEPASGGSPISVFPTLRVQEAG